MITPPTTGDRSTADETESVSDVMQYCARTVIGDGSDQNRDGLINTAIRSPQALCFDRTATNHKPDSVVFIISGINRFVDSKSAPDKLYRSRFHRVKRQFGRYHIHTEWHATGPQRMMQTPQACSQSIRQPGRSNRSAQQILFGPRV